MVEMLFQMVDDWRAVLVLLIGVALAVASGVVCYYFVALMFPSAPSILRRLLATACRPDPGLGDKL